jgi:hypothetical protein
MKVSMKNKAIIFILLSTKTLFVFTQVLTNNDSVIQNINTEKYGEAFPYLSDDALRVYFTSNRDGLAKIYYSFRTNKKSKFYKPICIVSDSVKGFYSFSLTKNELELYCISDDTLFFAKRDRQNQPFTQFIKVKGLNGCYFAPSISPNGKELIILRSWSCDTIMHQKDRLECFVKLKEDSFALLYKFPDIKHYEFKPGQFSKSGKKLYTNISPYISFDKRNSIDTSILVCFEREKTNSKFKKYKVIKTMSIKEIVTQVSSSYDEKISIGVTGKRWEWDSTNLKYILDQ